MLTMSTRTSTLPASQPRRRRVWPVLAAGLAIFFVVLTLLAYQVRTGHDPALGQNAVALVTSGHSSGGGQRLVTSTSGAKTSSAPSASSGHASAATPLSTRTSGGRVGGEGGHDD